jgi:DNA-binding transcriptional regulator GbsR (MarR family)
VDQKIERFVEKMGLLFEADGNSRTAGRLLGLLMLSPRPYSLDELAELLKVSKASISTNARALERYGTIERSTRVGDRRDYYQVADTMPLHLTARRVEHLTRIRDLMGCARAGEQVCTDVQERFEQFESFFEAMITSMNAAREQWLAQQRAAVDEGAASVASLRAIG